MHNIWPNGCQAYVIEKLDEYFICRSLMVSIFMELYIVMLLPSQSNKWQRSLWKYISDDKSSDLLQQHPEVIAQSPTKSLIDLLTVDMQI